MCVTLNRLYVPFCAADRVSVRISPPNAVPSLHQPLDLVCHVNTLGGLPGQSEAVWYKDGQKLTLRENMLLLQNVSLHFDSLLPSDAGFYQCETSLQALQQRSVFSLGFQLSCKH